MSNGKLKTSTSPSGETLLPRNTFNLTNDPNEDARFFVGGDVRVNEQMGLLVMHTIFVRAHNQIAELIIDGVRSFNPTDTELQIDELVYQYAKLIITAIIQK